MEKRKQERKELGEEIKKKNNTETIACGAIKGGKGCDVIQLNRKEENWGMGLDSLNKQL